VSHALDLVEVAYWLLIAFPVLGIALILGAGAVAARATAGVAGRATSDPRFAAKVTLTIAGGMLVVVALAVSLR
jgi:hypothetical protein